MESSLTQIGLYLDMSESHQNPCVVLVTGGNGFLGQHVVGLLQTKAEHVTEIKVLDVVPYENKLDYQHRKPVKSIVGSVTDETVLQQACIGVHSVIHIAGIPDSNMFPDKEKIDEVNIRGTMVTLLAALTTPGLKRFIYCSSMSVAIGDSDVKGPLSETDPVPSSRYFEPYASSKLESERIVLAANSESFRTIALRPLVMWGELDTIFVNLSQRIAAWTFGYLPTIKCDVKQHNAYVGNTAWGFVCAETALYHEQKTDIQQHKYIPTLSKRKEFCSELRRRSKRKPLEVTGDIVMEADEEKPTSGVYYIADDTPAAEPFEFQRPFLEETGYRLVKYSTPLFIVAIFFYLMYLVLRLLRLVGLSVNFPVGLGCIDYYKKSFVFNDSKARSELGYQPLYTLEQAKERSMAYYRKFNYK